MIKKTQKYTVNVPFLPHFFKSVFCYTFLKVYFCYTFSKSVFSKSV